jgi:hypothetical protein
MHAFYYEARENVEVEIEMEKCWQTLSWILASSVMHTDV